MKAIIKILKHIISMPMYWLIFGLILEFIDFLLYF